MSGLRIHHPTLRNCVLIVPHPGDKATGRKGKDYHVHLDNEGDALVSETVWKRLQEASPHTFILMNTVLHPPTQILHWGQREEKKIYKQLQDVARGFAPNGTVPRITRKDKK